MRTAIASALYVIVGLHEITGIITVLAGIGLIFTVWQDWREIDD